LYLLNILEYKLAVQSISFNKPVPGAPLVSLFQQLLEPVPAAPSVSLLQEFFQKAKFLQ
jgi:hypothetical protein